MIGQTVSHYRITAKIGSGGMGEVYPGESARSHRWMITQRLSVTQDIV